MPKVFSPSLSLQRKEYHDNVLLLSPQIGNVATKSSCLPLIIVRQGFLSRDIFSLPCIVDL